MPRGIWNARDVTSSSSKTDMPLEEGKDIKYGGREKERDARYTGIEGKRRWLRREEEGIAGSECKSTASDQSTTRTTRNRKDSLFLFIFVKFPPLPSHFPPLAARPFVSSLPFSEIFFCRWRLARRSRGPARRHVEHRKILHLLKRDSISIAPSRDRWFIDVILTGRE